MHRHFSYANVASSLALFLALSTGGAFAATKLTGKDIRDSSLTGKDVKNRSLTGADVKDGSIALVDLAAAARVAGAPGPAGAAGATGAAGSVGATGLAGADGQDADLAFNAPMSKFNTGAFNVTFPALAVGECTTQDSPPLNLGDGLQDDTLAASPLAPVPTGYVYSASPSATNVIRISLCRVETGPTYTGARTFRYTAIDA